MEMVIMTDAEHAEQKRLMWRRLVKLTTAAAVGVTWGFLNGHSPQTPKPAPSSHEGLKPSGGDTPAPKSGALISGPLLKGGVSIMAEQSRGVDCTERGVRTRMLANDMVARLDLNRFAGEALGIAPPQDPTIFLGSMTGLTGDGYYGLSDGWALRYNSAPGNYTVYHFVAREVKPLEFEGEDPVRMATAYGEPVKTFTLQALEKGIGFTDANTTLRGVVDLTDTSSPLHLTIACNNSPSNPDLKV